MSYLDTWRSQLKDDLAEFASLAKEDSSFHLIYTITAGAVLWGVRDAPNHPEQAEALQTACGDEKYFPLLKQVVDGWDKKNPLEALYDLNKRQRTTPNCKKHSRR